MKKILTLLLITSLSACRFGDTNIDPVSLTTSSVEELLPSAISQSIRNINSIGGRVTGIIIQHYEGVDAQPQAYDQYLIDERTLDVFWKSGLYAGAMKDCRLIIEQAAQSGQYRYSGIAKILLAHNLGMATAYWGDIPCSEAFRAPSITQPVYDSQEYIYHQIQDLLISAIAELESEEATEDLSADLIFGGYAQRWIATAHAMRARYYLHLSKRNTAAAELALAILQEGAFKELSEQPDFYYEDNRNEANPFALFQVERPGQMMLGRYLVNLMETTADPRLPRLGIKKGDSYELYQSDNEDLYWSQNDTAIPLISLTEIQFIEAEALLRLGRKDEAELSFKKAVDSHFKQMAMDTNETEGFIASYIHFDDIHLFEEQLEKLITQKYIALFGQASHEAWNDYRRTNYPRLMPPDAVNSSFNPSLIIPRRYLYPLSERSTNAIQYELAIQRQDGHFMDVDTWAFKDD
ncbi:MAG: SusD/RagB family nutrient-binding outer membrane lipoprotein [Bacteroidota bacterium]